MLDRPRRNRKSPSIRDLCQETRLGIEDLVMPLFVHENSSEFEKIEAMPSLFRTPLSRIADEAKVIFEKGIRAVALFPVIDPSQKDPTASASLLEDGLVPRAIKEIKNKTPELMVITDIALDPYSSDGHDGIVKDGKILNDPTLDILSKMATLHARHGADMVAPSDMMDGRVQSIRNALDMQNLKDVGILAYTAKYASCFYGPFRSALDSKPQFGDKKTYQMNPANVREALREMELDEAEGADILMVKPALAYLDVISKLKQRSFLPIAAYQVSGEYSMIEAAAEKGWIDRKAAALESLLSIKRAGADMIFSYYSKEAALWLEEG